MKVVKCLNCGYCCTKVACSFGIYNLDKKRCEYLTQDNLCSKYNEIVKKPEQKISPAFGYGCCSSLFNEKREQRKKELGIKKEVYIEI